MIENLKNKIISLFFTGDRRTVSLKKNVVLSLFFKALSIGLNYLFVPMSINYLGKANYGVWLVISSLLGYIDFLDIGLGNGLRNKFAESKVKNKTNLIRVYVSSAYAIISMTIFTVIGLFYLSSLFFNWSVIINIPDNFNKNINFIFLFVLTAYGLKFILRLIAAILTADQKPAIKDMFLPISTAISFILLVLVIKYNINSFFTYCVIFSVPSVFIFLCANLFLFSKHYRDYSPSIRFVNLKQGREMLNIGIKFFIIQITYIILFNTDNLIITHFIGMESVVDYNISKKIFNPLLFVFSTMLYPVWSASTEAFYKNDFKWIKQTIKKFTFIWFIFLLFSIIVIFLARPIFNIWIGGQYTLTLTLNIGMAAFTMLYCWNLIFNQFINGAGKIFLQLLLSSISALLNIPLSIFLAVHLQLGVSGVILATVMSLLIHGIFIPIQYHRLINNKAKGIWNK